MPQFPDSNGLEAPLERIGLSGPVAATEEGLAQLHLHHGEAIAFENFDILPGRGFSVRPLLARVWAGGCAVAA